MALVNVRFRLSDGIVTDLDPVTAGPITPAPGEGVDLSVPDNIVQIGWRRTGNKTYEAVVVEPTDDPFEGKSATQIIDEAAVTFQEGMTALGAAMQTALDAARARL